MAEQILPGSSEITQEESSRVVAAPASSVEPLEMIDLRKWIIDAAKKKAGPSTIIRSRDITNIDTFLNGVVLDAPQYESTQPEFKTKTVIFSQSFDNDTDKDSTAVLKKSITTPATFTWSFTRGWTKGVKTTFQAKPPFFDSPFSDLTVEVDLASTHEFTKKKTQTWDFDVTITVPNRSRVTTELAIQPVAYNQTFTVPIRFYKEYYFDIKVSKTETLKMKPSEVFSRLPKYKEDVDTEGEYGHSSYTATGNFKSIRGIQSVVTARQATGFCDIII